MFDINRRVQLIRGALFDPEATWRSHLPEAGDWQKTAILITGLLIVPSTVLAYIFGFISSDTSLFGMFRPTIEGQEILSRRDLSADPAGSGAGGCAGLGLWGPTRSGAGGCVR